MLVARGSVQNYLPDGCKGVGRTQRWAANNHVVTEIAYIGTEIAHVGTEIAHVGTEIAQVGTEIAQGNVAVDKQLPCSLQH